MPLQIGDSLGRYTLLKRLAVGGMGEVYLAAKPGPVGFGPKVALKILRDELASDQQFVDMLVDEANISMFLNHQNVVSVLDLSEDHNVYYIAMEFVQGINVEQVLEKLIAQQKKLDLSTGLFIASELCRALKYAHTRVNHAGEPLNIVHRDVTPANILISVQGEVKLTDFGIARAKGRIHQTQAGVLKGKFGYMAPEMIRYEEIDARADLFCAGVCIYLMITMRHPVAGATVMEAIQRYEDKQIPRPSSINAEVPAALDQIVMRCLEPKPDNRWASAAALGAALQDVVLKNPVWRREVQDGATRLAELLRSTAPEVFDDPIPAEAGDRMLKEALAREASAAKKPEPAALKRAATGPTTDKSHSALEPDLFSARTQDGQVPASLQAVDRLEKSETPFAEPKMVANPELDTEEGLALADIFAARDELNSEYQRAKEAANTGAAALEAGLRAHQGVSLKKSAPRPLPQPATGDFPKLERMPAASIDPMEHDGEEAPTGLAPIERTMAMDALEMSRTDTGLDVLFPDSSTDRNRMHEEMMEEQELPQKRAPSDESTANGTGIGSGIDDGRTVVGMLPPSSDPLPLDDSKTVAGMSIPDWDPSSEEIRDPMVAEVVISNKQSPASSPVRKGRIDPDKTRAYAMLDMIPGGGKVGTEDLDDAETVIPLGKQLSGSEPGDPTLLDGLDARAVQVEKQRRGGRAKPTVVKTPDVKGRAPHDTQEEAAPKELDVDMDQVIADSFKTGKFQSPPLPTGPQLLDGPVRIVMGSDGTPSLGQAPANTEEQVAQSPGSPQHAAAALASNAQSAEAQKKRPAPMREKKQRTSEARGASPEVKPVERTNPPVPNSDDTIEAPEVGMQTGRWMAGELDAAQLEWDDDAAARRAVATRNKGTILGPGMRVQPQQSPPQSPQSPQSFAPAVSAMGAGVRYPGGTVGPDGRIIPEPDAEPVGRNWVALTALGAASAAVVVVFGVLFFTSLLWPKLKLESDPPGAAVIVDDVPAEHVAPVMVKVEPERPHIVEFRLEGYRTERREISDGVGRGRTYTLQVGLRKILPAIEIRPVEGTVFVNYQRAGKGQHVVLANLPKEGEVKLRVEADGHLPWEASFEKPSAVPESIDVALQPDPSQAEEKAPPPPKKR